MKRFRQATATYDPKRFDDAMLKMYGESIFVRGIRVMTNIATGQVTPEEVERYVRGVANAVKQEHARDARFYDWREGQLEVRWGRASKFCEQYPGTNWLNLARFLVRAKETLFTATKLAEVEMRDVLDREAFASLAHQKMIANLERGAVRGQKEEEDEADFMMREIDWAKRFGFLRVVRPYIECWLERGWAMFAQVRADDPKPEDVNPVPTKTLLLPAGVDLHIEIILDRKLEEQMADYQRQIDTQRLAVLKHLQSAEAQMPLSAAYLRSEVGDNSLLVTQASQKMAELLAQMDMEGLGQAAADAAKLKTRGVGIGQQLEHLEGYFAGETIEDITFDKDVIAARTLRAEELQTAETAEAQVTHFTQLLAQTREKLAAQEEAEAQRRLAEQQPSTDPNPPGPDPTIKTRTKTEGTIAKITARLQILTSQIADILAGDDPDYGEVGTRSAEAKDLKSRSGILQAELAALPPEVDPAVEIARIQTAIAETTARLKTIGGEIAAIMTADNPDYGEVGTKSAEAAGLKVGLAELQAELEGLPPVPVMQKQQEADEAVVDQPIVITVASNGRTPESVDITIRAMRAAFGKLSKIARRERRKLFDDGAFNVEFARDSDTADQNEVTAKAAELAKALESGDWDTFRDISVRLESMAG